MTRRTVCVGDKQTGDKMRRVFAVLIGFLWPVIAWAHEVVPTIGDLTVADGVVRLELALTAEPLIAGLDLDGVANTDDTDKAGEVDALRLLPPEDLIPRIAAIAPSFATALNLRIDQAPVALTLVESVVDPVGNPELPRVSKIVFQGVAPAGGATLDLSWPQGYGEIVLRQQGVDEPYTGFLFGGQDSGPITLGGGDQLGGWATFGQYIPVGFDHILPKGLDHILFVLGLFFLSTQLGSLVWQVSAFTLAHTVTLALAVLGYVSVPASIVEPLIAASIVYVAVENIVSDRLNRWRPLVIFGFGLLHGLGFASVLGEFGLPESQVVPALIGFNVGVELGQLTVIALAFALVWYAQKVDRIEADPKTAQIGYAGIALAFVAGGWLLNTPGFAEVMGAGAPVFLWPVAALAGLCALAAYKVDRLQAYRRFVAIPASLAIALVGAFWFVERVFL